MDAVRTAMTAPSHVLYFEIFRLKSSEAPSRAAPLLGLPDFASVRSALSSSPLVICPLPMKDAACAIYRWNGARCSRRGDL